MADTARIPALSLWRPWPTLILSHGKLQEAMGHG
jgi:hypothetical protein